MTTEIDKVLAGRVSRIMDRFRKMAREQDAKRGGGYQIQNYMEEIQLHFNGYGEPGYSVGASGIVATGNWNTVTRWDNVEKQTRTVSKLPAQLCDILGKLGVECEWSDEWTTCNDCGVLIRTEPDGWDWKPSYIVGEAELLCTECGEATEEDDIVDDEDTSPDSCDERLL